jgi:hypothetical protein
MQIIADNEYLNDLETIRYKYKDKVTFNPHDALQSAQKIYFFYDESCSKKIRFDGNYMDLLKQFQEDALLEIKKATVDNKKAIELYVNRHKTHFDNWIYEVVGQHIGYNHDKFGPELYDVLTEFIIRFSPYVVGLKCDISSIAFLLKSDLKPDAYLYNYKKYLENKKDSDLLCGKTNLINSDSYSIFNVKKVHDLRIAFYVYRNCINYLILEQKNLT